MVLDNGRNWVVEDFQAIVVESLFSGVAELWVVIPEGNGKTTLMGGVALYYADYTESGSILLGAASRDQCGWLLGQAGGFVKRSPGFDRRFRWFEGYRRIESYRTGSRIQVFAADDRTGDGAIPDLGLLDELHRHRDLRLYRTWAGKLDKKGGQIATISTGGDPGGEFEIARSRIKNEADELAVDGSHTRAVAGRVILHDWMVPADQSVDDMAAVKAANPFSGITEETLRAKHDSPTMTPAHWARLVCNQPTRDDDAAITEAEWSGLKLAAGDDIPEGEPVWLGLDLGWKWDTTAATPLWMPDLERRWFAHVAIIPPPRDGTSTLLSTVQSALLDIHERNPVHTIVMDENAGGSQLCEWIEEVLGAKVIAHSQGHSAMALAYERWMEAMRAGAIRHDGDPEFSQHVLNAVARLLPGGQTRFDRRAGARNTRTKGTQDSRVWDALTAASMAHSVAVASFENASIPVDPANYRIERL